VDIRLVRRVGIVLCLALLAALSIALFTAGARRNNQIDTIHRHGVPVVMTVTGCTGLLGGSGSNPVGEVCRGSYTLGGHRYNEVIPGTTDRTPGSRLAAIAVPGDPSLVTTAHDAATEQASGRVFVLPGVLGGLFVALAAGWLLVRRRARGGDGERAGGRPAD
jgi:hypothetical protein